MFSLIRLPYSYKVLEPYIDARTMEIHHGKHHQSYVDKLNAALVNYPAFQSLNVLELIRSLDKIPEEIRTAVRNNAGGDACHTWYFTGIGPNEGGDPRGALGAAIGTTFGGYEQFRRQFAQAVSDVFGSEWVWLSRDGAGKLLIETTPGNDNPWMFGRIPILAFDVWEHAYYFKHQNRCAEALDAWWNVVDWDRAEERFQT
ncbi:MAG: superoxide dismutase [Thermoguttaceae bacterium]|jgi:Fe-Mn family superoxide dismutase